MEKTTKDKELSMEDIYRYFDGELDESSAIEVFKKIQKDPRAQLLLENLAMTRVALNQYTDVLADRVEFDTLWKGIDAGIRLDQQHTDPSEQQQPELMAPTQSDLALPTTSREISPRRPLPDRNDKATQSWWPRLPAWGFGLGFASAAAVLVFGIFMSTPKTATGHDVRVERFEVADGMVGTIFSVDEEGGGTMKVLWLSSTGPYHGATTDMDALREHMGQVNRGNNKQRK